MGKSGLDTMAGSIELTSKARSQEMSLTPQSLPQAESDHLFALFNGGRYVELEDRARILVARYPDAGVAWKALGASLQMQGKEALPVLQRAAELLPDDAAAQSNLGRELRSLGQLNAAIACFHRVLEKKSDSAEAHSNLGSIMQDIGKLDEAVACYSRALEIDPGFVLAHNNLGATLYSLGKVDAAVASYRRALEIEPDNASAHNRLGVALRSLGDRDAAMASYSRALEIEPDNVSAHNNLGIAYSDCSQFTAAMASYRRALEIDPNFTSAYISLGVTLENLWQLDDAVESFCQAAKIDPDSARARSNLICMKNYMVGSSAAELLDEARQFGNLAARQAIAYTDWLVTSESDRCLRIGLVSPDLRGHPVGYFLESVLTALASNAVGRLDIVAYFTNIRTDAFTERIKASCHAWHSAVGFSIESLARKIRDDRIDILIDLSGHTASNCLPLFAWKPTPVQVSWLGYLGTTGLAEIDYVLADSWTLPESDEANFVERIWRLPQSYVCLSPPDSSVEVAPLPALSNHYITFGSFNNLMKVNGIVVALWARVLASVTNSRLLLKAKHLNDVSVRQRVLECFAAHGIHSDRLILEGMVPERAAHLATYNRVDIALDTFPYAGVTTTIESLWMGVPVLTLTGERFLSRQGVGLLMNAGLPDWIAGDADDYVARAMLQASDLQRLASLRESLRRRVLNSPLFDAPNFANHFEFALRGMWREWCFKQPHPSDQKKTSDLEVERLIDMFRIGRYAELETHTRHLIDQNPDCGIAWKLLGASIQVQGRDALPALQKAAELLPGDAEAQNNLGVALVGCGNTHEAITSFRRALKINPDYAGAHNSLGAILKVMGHLDDAVLSLRRALEIDPDFAQAHCNLGTALQELGHLDAAVASYQQALEINPDDADAHNNLGTAQSGLGRFEDAVASYRRALAIKPDYAEVRSNLLFIHNYLADQSAANLMAEARLYGDVVLRSASPQNRWSNVPDPTRCLRVGLVSGDLRIHPVGHFLDGVLTALSSIAAGRLELFGYANHHVADELTDRIRTCCRSWHSIVGVSDADLARKIRDDRIDVLIDLAGHTAHNRLAMFAWKPAPVQVSWLGYFATTGVTAIDYLLADPWTLPESEEVHFTEKVWRLPETRLCFTAPSIDIEVAPLPAFGNGHITFGCFNSLTKMNDAVVAMWARILAAVPDSRLFLKATQLNGNPTRTNVAERFAAHGIDTSRIIMEGSSPRAEYLATYNQIDIALDPFPYPGGATTVDSLWMGVPVLTLLGERFLARQGVGILTNVGLSGWIAADADDYVGRAVSYASDLKQVSQLRSDLRQQVLNSPIFDTRRFAVHLESALRGMWLAWCAEQPGVTKQRLENNQMKTFLHVGCGSRRKDKTTRGFNSPQWNELRLDINEAVAPDIVGTILDMSGVADEAVDAIFSSHNIEHIYAHEVPLALVEFRRVLKPDGFLVVTCPDLQSVCQLIVEDKLTEPAYISPSGPITPLDILYGHCDSMQQGNLYMAHRCGFTEKSLVIALQEAGFSAVVSGSRGHPIYDLWALATKGTRSEEQMAALAEAHFPE